MTGADQKAVTPRPSTFHIVSRVLVTRNGDTIAYVIATGGRRHLFWAVSHLPGVPLAGVRRRTPALLGDFGRRFVERWALRAPGDTDALAAAWQPLANLLEVHASAEEGIFYPVLAKK